MIIEECFVVISSHEPSRRNADDQPPSSAAQTGCAIPNNNNNDNNNNKEAEEGTSPQPRRLDLDSLGRESERRLRSERLARLPDTDDFHFEHRQKAHYYRNFYRLLVTARAEIQSRDARIQELEAKLRVSERMRVPYRLRVI